MKKGSSSSALTLESQDGQHCTPVDSCRPGPQCNASEHAEDETGPGNRLQIITQKHVGSVKQLTRVTSILIGGKLLWKPQESCQGCCISLEDGRHLTQRRQPSRTLATKIALAPTMPFLSFTIGNRCSS